MEPNVRLSMKQTFFINNHKLQVNTTTTAAKQYYSIIFLFLHPCKGNMNDEGVLHMARGLNLIALVVTAWKEK